MTTLQFSYVLLKGLQFILALLSKLALRTSWKYNMIIQIDRKNYTFFQLGDGRFGPALLPTPAFKSPWNNNMVMQL